MSNEYILFSVKALGYSTDFLQSVQVANWISPMLMPPFGTLSVTTCLDVSQNEYFSKYCIVAMIQKIQIKNISHCNVNLSIQWK